MTLDCSPALADRIAALLSAAEAAGTARCGTHRQSAALMTCFVPSPTRSDHVHFVDGAAGGYAAAARAVKLALMIPKSGYLFSEKIMLEQEIERDDDSKKNHPLESLTASAGHKVPATIAIDSPRIGYQARPYRALGGASRVRVLFSDSSHRFSITSALVGIGCECPFPDRRSP